MSYFAINLFCPDGKFTEKEVEGIFHDWFTEQLGKGVAYRIGGIKVKEISFDNYEGLRRKEQVAELLHAHAHQFKQEDEEADENQCGTSLYAFCEEVANEIDKIYKQRNRDEGH